MGVGRGVRVVQVLQRERVKRYSRARTVLMRILCILYDEKSPDDEYGQMFRLALSHGVTDQVISHGGAWKSAFDVLLHGGKLVAAKYYAEHDSTMMRCRLGQGGIEYHDFANALRCALLHAILSNNIAVVRTVVEIDAQAQIDEEGLFEEYLPCTIDGVTPKKLLSLAALRSNDEIFTTLLEAYPQQKLDAATLENSLDCAVCGGNLQIVERLFEIEAKPSHDVINCFTRGYPSTTRYIIPSSILPQDLDARAQVLYLIMENCNESQLFPTVDSVAKWFQFRREHRFVPLKPIFMKFFESMFGYVTMRRDLSMVYINDVRDLTHEDAQFLEDLVIELIRSDKVDIDEAPTRAAMSCQTAVLDEILCKDPSKITCLNCTDLDALIEAADTLSGTCSTCKWVIKHSSPAEQQCHLQVLVRWSEFSNRASLVLELMRYLVSLGNVDITKKQHLAIYWSPPLSPLEHAICCERADIVTYLLSLDAVKSDIARNPSSVFSLAIELFQIDTIRQIIDAVPETLACSNTSFIITHILTTAVTKYRPIPRTSCSAKYRTVSPKTRAKPYHHHFTQLLALTVLLPFSKSLSVDCLKYIPQCDLDLSLKSSPGARKLRWIELIRDMLVRVHLDIEDVNLLFGIITHLTKLTDQNIDWDDYMRICESLGLLPFNGWWQGVGGGAGNREEGEDVDVVATWRRWLCASDGDDALSSIAGMLGFHE